MQIGTVIDLTKSRNYYNPQEEVAQAGATNVQYYKIPCVGRGESPQPAEVNEAVFRIFMVRRSALAARDWTCRGPARADCSCGARCNLSLAVPATTHTRKFRADARMRHACDSYCYVCPSPAAPRLPGHGRQVHPAALHARLQPHR